MQDLNTLIIVRCCMACDRVTTCELDRFTTSDGDWLCGAAQSAVLRGDTKAPCSRPSYCVGCSKFVHTGHMPFKYERVQGFTGCHMIAESYIASTDY